MSERHTPATPAPMPPATERQRTAGQVAASLVALEAVILAGFAVFYLVELVRGQGQDLMIVIMSVVTMVVFIIGLSYTALGLSRRHPRSQAPAIAFNFLLVPLGIALLPLAPWWVGVGTLALGVVTVAATFLMGRLEDRDQTA
ncbi:hypothetical protein [Serinicoccus marinus]|uniref:hypothetical protein n=1 Tax=Serinicoccus marinus TaxID=247333 RepID=UPI00040AE992|nr:hypothetical protein [Serinicoccus marinus]